ncbi:MAG: B12-binding domain-containing protein [Acidobacteria bacterium]|nr:B12-binding domain-containing protein [Acidobacteriota bacterium]
MRLWTSTEAARALGVGTSSIKRWTDSGALQAVKTPGAHRRYTIDALRAFAAARGLPPDLLPPLDAPAVKPSRTRRRPTLLDAARSGDAAAVRGLVTPVTNDLAARAAFLDEVVGSTLREIGDRWHEGSLSVAEEHRATHLIAAAVDHLRPAVFPADSRVALLACPPGELHDLPLHLVRLVLEWGGWRTDFVGANTPWKALEGAISRVDLVAFTARSGEPFHTREFRHFLARCRARKVGVAVGGEWCRGGTGRDAVERFRTLRGFVKQSEYLKRTFTAGVRPTTRSRK